MIRIPSPATTSARTGATRAGITTFSSRPSNCTPSVPTAANVAPTMPPMSACELEDGRPKYHVARFQAIAPIRPANTICGVTTSASTMPEAIVAATASERNAPTKFRAAAIVTAERGPIARVEIEVATAFAVSWNPFVKSNARAVPTTIHRTTSDPMRLLVLDDDALEDVRHRLGGVDPVLEALEDVLPADHQHRVDAALEQRGEGLAEHAVAVVLQAVDLDRVVVDVLEGAQARDRARDRAGRLVQDPRHLGRLVHRRLDPVQRQEVRRLLDEVDDVVERRRQRVDVLAVDRRHERRVQALDDVVRDPVALLLADHDLARERGVVGPLLEHPLEQLGGAHDVRARLLEEVEELAFLGGEQLGEPRHGGPVYVKKLSTRPSGTEAAAPAGGRPPPARCRRCARPSGTPACARPRRTPRRRGASPP